MEKYDYEKAVKDDIRTGFATGEYSYDKKLPYEDNFEELYEAMWIDDSITGNGSGSYTFNTWEAEENLCHNNDLLEETFKEFEYYPGGFVELDNVLNAEYCDVSIRCYLLNNALIEVLAEMGYTEDTQPEEE